MTVIAENIRSIVQRISKAASACGRSADDVVLLAVSKNFPVESISRAVAAGLRRFGENRIQEAEGKIPSLMKFRGLEWHLVGHLQSNKARRAAQLFDVIHSLDSLKLAYRLDNASLEAGKVLSVLLQVNLEHEETKFGADRDQIRDLVEAVSKLKNLCLNGLMAIPPFFEDSEKARPYFAQLRELRDSLESEQPGCLGRQELSMGMTQDFETAIQEGATIVRIGTAIFGRRSYD